MKLKIAACIALSLTVLSSCSTIVSKSDYEVQISSEPTGANYVITNRTGNTVSSGVTPQLVNLKTSAGYFKAEQYLVDVSKEGYISDTSNIQTSLDPWYFGNIIGGVLGMIFIDPATGAMYQLPQQSHTTLTADKHSASPTQASKTTAGTSKQNGVPNTLSIAPTSRISFEGIYYDIEPGSIIGERRVGNGSRIRKQLAWPGQKNPYQYNELVESLLEKQGYKLSSYQDRLLKFDNALANDLKIGMIVEHINVEHKQSVRYSKEFHKVDMRARFKIFQSNEKQIIYSKVFSTSAKDVARSKSEILNAYPIAIKDLVKQLILDPEFIALIRPIANST